MGRTEGEHVGQRRDDVDSEADEERSNGRVDGPKEREDDGQEPDGHHHRQPSQRPLADAPALMHPYGLLPHEVQRRACEPESSELWQWHT